MATSPARRPDRRRFVTISAVTVLTAALAVPALAAGPSVPTAKKTTKKVVPKSGSSCAKSQVGARYGTLVCKKSGSSYKWTKVSSSSASSSGSASTPGSTAADTEINPSQIDVITLVSGAAPATYALKVDVKCNGLAQSPKDAVASFSFGSQSSSNQTTFKLSPPTVDNPTGSTCAVTSTSSGGSPSIRLLINGRPATNPSTAAASTTPDFTAEGPYTVTALVDFGGSAPAAAPAATSTTAPTGGATTTLAPPASGKPEVGVRWAGVVPAVVQGIDIDVICTNPAQTQRVRLGRSDATTALTLASALTATSQCQVTGTLVGAAGALVGSDASSAIIRILLRGNVVSGPSAGSPINSPAFAAPTPWQATFEITYPGGSTTTTTTPGSTTSSSTTTTLPPRATVALARTGTAPGTVTGYTVDIACTNVWQNGSPLVFANWNAVYPVAGASADLPFAFGANSTCSVKVTTNGGTTGNVGVAINGTVVAAGVNGTVQTATISTPAAFTTAITVAY